MRQNAPEDNRSNYSSVGFFHSLYHAACGTLVFCRKAEKGFTRLACFDLPQQLNEAITFAADPKNTDCYYKYNLFNGASLQARGVNTIGSKRELSTLVAFGLDVDVSAKDSKYTDQQTARLLLDLMPLPPSAIIGSNGPNAGLHAYWFLHPVAVATPEHYEYIRLVSRRWYRELAKIAAPSKIDHTSGPERLLRPPGALRASGQLVTVLDMPGYRYSIEQFLLPPDEQDQAGHAKQENEDSIILDYLHDVANIHSPEPIMLQAGWTSRNDDYTLWDRPESTSGAPTAQVYCSGDGRMGVTIKTPGLIRTLATDPITGERISSAVPDTPKWLNLQAFYTFMSQGGLTPECWQRASKFARDRMPRGVEFDVVPQLPQLAPPKQRAAGREQVATARREIVDLASATNRLLRMARAIVEIGLSDSQAWDILSELDCTLPIKEPSSGVASPLTREELCSVLRQMEIQTIRGCRSLPAHEMRGANDTQDIALRVLATYWGWLYDDPNRCRLKYWRNQWFMYNGRCWKPKSDSNIESLLNRQAREIVDKKAQQILAAYHSELTRSDPQKPPKRPTFPAIGGTILKDFRKVVLDDYCFLADEIQPPHDINDKSDRDPKTPKPIIIFENGIAKLHQSSKKVSLSELSPHDTAIFSLCSLPFDYDPNATCPRWLKFLEEVFSLGGVRDVESEELLQEWLGLNLVQDLKYHKLLNVIGPPRSGKGTISKVIEGLLGEENVGHPAITQFSEPFGLASLQYCPAIVIEDSRLSGGSGEREKILSHLLSISAGDKSSVNRKGKDVIEQRLPGRITIFSNAVIKINDNTKAFATRLLLLQTRQSFFGREDRDLESKLRAELPGIFNWAFQGLQRLRSNDRFTEPESTRDLMQVIKTTMSPISEFIDQFCDWKPTGSVMKETLYRWYHAWAEHNGYRNPLDSSRFATTLMEMFPDLTQTRPSGGERKRIWCGLSIKERLLDIDPRIYFAFGRDGFEDFIDQFCLVDIEREAQKEVLYRWYLAWSQHNRQQPMNIDQFTQKITAAVSQIEDRGKCLKGVTLKDNLLPYRDPCTYFEPATLQL
jgi:putative DNA primase/helicase